MNPCRRIKKIARVVIAARRAVTLLHPLRAAVGGIYYVVCLGLLLHWPSVQRRALTVSPLRRGSSEGLTATLTVLERLLSGTTQLRFLRGSMITWHGSGATMQFASESWDPEQVGIKMWGAA